MRLFVVTKQFTVRRDFLADRYGRTWHLPAELARRGHEVHGCAGAYHGSHAAAAEERFGSAGGVSWHGRFVRPYWPPDVMRYLRVLRERAQACSAQAVFACMDAFHLMAGQRTARALGVPLIVDFCDNYESYGRGLIPGTAYALRTAARAAAAVTFVSEPLQRHLKRRYGLRAPAVTLENGVDPSFFAAPSRAAARAALGLPADARLLGTAGALDASRGIGALYDAFLCLAAQDDSLYLTLAGEPDVAPPAHPRVRLLGSLTPAQMPSFWRALDVAVICIRDDAFGRYCFPYKLGEIAAVGTPAVFPRFGMFAEPQAASFGVAAATADGVGYAQAIRQQFERPRAPRWQPPTWAGLAARFESFVAEAIGPR